MDMDLIGDECCAVCGVCRFPNVFGMLWELLNSGDTFVMEWKELARFNQICNIKGSIDAV